MKYEKCVSCKELGVNCDGANFALMPLTDMVKWCAARKKYLGWNNARIAEAADISKTTVDRIFAGTTEDLRLSTIRPVLLALIGSTPGENPCLASAYDFSNMHDMKRDNDNLQRLLAVAQEEETYAKESIGYYRGRVNSLTKGLAIVIALLFITLVAFILGIS